MAARRGVPRRRAVVSGAGIVTELPMSREQWREEVARRLDAVRPERYHEDDRAWMEPVVRWAEENMPPGVRAQALRGMIDEEDEVE